MLITTAVLKGTKFKKQIPYLISRGRGSSSESNRDVQLI